MPFWLLLTQQICKFDQSCHSARVIIGTRGISRVVMRPTITRSPSSGPKQPITFSYVIHQPYRIGLSPGRQLSRNGHGCSQRTASGCRGGHTTSDNGLRQCHNMLLQTDWRNKHHSPSSSCETVDSAQPEQITMKARESKPKSKRMIKEPLLSLCTIRRAQSNVNHRRKFA